MRTHSAQDRPEQQPSPRIRLRGQSIPLIALMIAILVGMVGLSVDVGHTYAEQREVVRAANAAAVAGMQTRLEQGTDDARVWGRIVSSFAENGIEVMPPGSVGLGLNQRRVRALYLGADGNPLSGCFIVGSCGGEDLAQVSFIQVEVDGEVDTFFARAVGQEQLPIASTAFAGICPPINGMMPIGVRYGLIDVFEEEFAQADGIATIPDIVGPEQEKTYKRLQTGPLAEGSTDFGFLRWLPSYTPADLPDMMAGAGNRSWGFEEVAEWPEDSTEPPDGYPIEPEYLTDGDWAHGFTYRDPGLGEAALISLITDQLDYHIENRSRVILPLYRVAFDEGSEAVFHVVQFGEFFINGYDVTDQTLDLIFIQFAPRIPCPAENVEVPDKFGLVGPVFITPRYASQPEEEKPVGATIMLDVSGSMSWNFEGWGSHNGRDYQCEAFDPRWPDVPYTYGPDGIGDCLGGPRAYWRRETDRRAYIIREGLINIWRSLLDEEDRIRIVAFSSNVEATSPQWYGIQNLEGYDHIRTIGEYSGNGVTTSPTYLTNGGTNGASALNRARQFLTSGFPDGLRPVAIYMTDGVSNKNDGYSSGTKPECAAMESGERTNTAFCQIGYVDGRALPISQMREISRQMHDDLPDDFQLYVLGMGRADFTGLDQVATHPTDNFYTAAEAADVSSNLQQIWGDAESVDCDPRVEPEVTRILGANQPDRAILDAAGVPPDSFGFVLLYKDGVHVANVPIKHDAGGRLVYYLPSNDEDALVPGVYDMQAWVAYNASGEPEGTYIYDAIIDQNTLLPVGSLTLTVNESSVLGDLATGPEIHFDLQENIDVCAALD